MSRQYDKFKLKGHHAITLTKLIRLLLAMICYLQLIGGLWLIIGGVINIVQDKPNISNHYASANCTVYYISREVYQPFQQDDPYCCNVKVKAHISADQIHDITIADCVDEQGSGCNYWRNGIKSWYICYVKMDFSYGRCPGNCGEGTCNGIPDDTYSCLQRWDNQFDDRRDSNVLMIFLGIFVFLFGIVYTWILYTRKQPVFDKFSRSITRNQGGAFTTV